MSTRLPVVKVKTFEKLLFHLGFETKRRSGSHVFYRHHGNQDIGRSLTRQILREIEITPEQFINLLKEL
jgi:predicted RNA binding protein YcfA (HicA-like mRNA interferase family)